VSEEPFGWATYHYGRWTRLRDVGWIWVPGEEWAPAWVSWRTSNNYVGWAPLPPEARFDRRRGIQKWADNYYDIGPEQYAFVSDSDFGSEHVQRAVVPTERNVTIVNETTNVTNITYNNTTVINQGPDYEQLRARSQRPIERYHLERQAQMNGETARPIVRGEVIEMPAPVITPVQGVDRPRTVKQTVTQATVDTGWAIADRSAAERARAKMKAEATPPPDAPPKRFVKPAGTPTASMSPATAPVITATPAASATVHAVATPVRIVSPAPAITATPATAAKVRQLGTPVRMVSPAPTARATVSLAPISSPTAPPRKEPLKPATSATISPAASVSPRPSAIPRITPAAATPVATPKLPAQSPALGLPTQEQRAAAQRAEMERRIEAARKPKTQPSPAASLPSATAVPSSSPAASRRPAGPRPQFPVRVSPIPLNTPPPRKEISPSHPSPTATPAASIHQG
jgi:hypothetical protein